MNKALPSSKSVAVVGAGTMGRGIAQVAALAGHTVYLYDANASLCRGARNLILGDVAKLVNKGKLSSSAAKLAEGIIVCEGFEDLAGASLVVEAIFEDFDAKAQVLSQLERVCGPDTVIGSNTSSFSITRLAGDMRVPSRLVGMHFFNPAPVMPLVEIVRGLESDDAAVKLAFDTAAAWGKKPVVTASTPGFIVNRVARPFYAEALRLVEEGIADFVTIDAVMKEAAQFRMGPFELMDLIGQDVNYAVTKSVFEAFYYDPRFKPSLVQQELVHAGRLGRKTGRGWYDYGNGAGKAPAQNEAPAPSPPQIRVAGRHHLLESLIDLADEARIRIERDATADIGEGYIKIGDALLFVTDGRTVAQRTKASGIRNLFLLDQVRDFRRATRVALAASPAADAGATSSVVGFLQAIGKSVSRVEDLPGMVVARTMSMIINEAAEALHVRVASSGAIDDAMRNGANYPGGPFEWLRSWGARNVLTIVENLASAYGEDRYRPSFGLRRLADAEEMAPH